MSELFSTYPASSDSIREIARKTSASGTAFIDVRDEIDSSHRDALDQVAGDLNSFIGPKVGPYKADASQAAKAAIWAACQLENFADAIDVYNKTSIDPRSISKLNQAYADLAADEIRHSSGALHREKAALDDVLDEAAAKTAGNLDEEPTDADIEREWKEGNLPVAAIAAWPHLKLRLTDLPVVITNSAITLEGLRHLSDKQLAAALADGNLNFEIRNTILKNREGAVDIFKDNWTLTIQAGRPPDTPCGENINGVVVGPEGHVFPVDVPDGPPESDTPVIRAQGDVILDDGTGSGWRTVGRSTGKIAFGEEVDLTAQTTYATLGSSARVGLTDPPGEWQSIGEDQDQYLHIDGEATYVADGTDTPDELVRPTLDPYPDYMKPPDENNMHRASNGATLVVGTLEGLNNAQQAESNRHWMTEVVLQENDNGERRAVVNMYQVQTNGQGLRVGHLFGTVDPATGEIIAYSDPSKE